jgi:integrase/recombinase XerD
MATFTLTQSSQAPSIFLVVGPDGLPVSAINEFLLHLSHCGRSAYTLRSYARGLAHFFGWLHTTGRHVDEVTSQTVETYIAFFSTETKGGACPVDPHRVGQINLRTRKSSPAVHRQARTINHQLSVLASFFAYRIRQNTERGVGHGIEQTNPVPASPSSGNNAHGMPGRDAPRRGKAGELRRRVPRRIPQQVDPTLAQQLIDAATSWRDKAILTLLYRTGQRIGDWSAYAGRHGILGMTLADIDERSGTITVLLKGARDEHRVPVTDDFWPLFHQYLKEERKVDSSVSAVWVGLRKGKGHPLSYASFESSLRYIGRKLGANVNAHMFRHTLAQAIVDLGNLKVAQDILGHRHLETTADIYALTSQRAMVEALSAAKSPFDVGLAAPHHSPSTAANRSAASRYVFAYDEATVQELDQVTLHPSDTTT